MVILLYIVAMDLRKNSFFEKINYTKEKKGKKGNQSRKVNRK